ncbi:putative type I restriction enzyme HindVIIP specificity protein [Glaesserella parasuis 29755]|uniref:restriction endonuclease subunit S n=1 Tax=Glaesserella parasuis TaxID=738 RepID=UPI000165B638|nr:restriction endonuclease subunit S [Glaesserella parasuis]AWY45679.1 restriction endonuclease subunit S [Glaesserella parasuis 29755]EQA96101.1 type I restriction modification DNA specificity domain protein [Glaesserella parasuis 29755]CDH98894.1 putative type I restriction enzyme HindVIIP specificity protein [Glaesserella parasuis 29755]
MSKLGDFVRVQGGYAFKSSELSDDKTGVPVIKIGNITGGSFVDLSNYQSVSFQLFEKTKSFATKDNDILIAMTGANVGKTSRVPVNSDAYLINQRVGRFLLKEDCPYTSDFIYYVVSSKQAYQYFSRVADGAAQPNISGKTIEDLEFPNIDSRCANKIGNILKSLDDKIQLNTQINQTLEQIAQTIFKSWFIDFDPVHAKANALASGQTAEQATQAAMAVISGKNTQELHRLQTANPEQYQQLWEITEAFPSGFDEEGVPRGWEQTTLSEVCSMKNGYAFKSSDWTEEGIPVIKIGSVKPMIVEVDGNGFVDEEHSVLHSEFLLTEGDIVVGLTGYVGEVGRIPQGRTAMLNQRVAKFIPNKLNEQQDYYSFVYCLVRDKSFKAFAETNAKGSAQANISTKELLNYSIILASPEIQMKFESLIKPLLDKILVNSGNNEYLSKVRDLLLPNLLSGEIHL